MGRKSDPLDREIGRIAAQQHGVITTAQLVSAGIGTSGITKRVCRGGLYRLYQGVYSVGHCGISREKRWMAAVLACGEGAALSHGSAAALWGLLRPVEGPIEVSVPTRAGRRKRRGIRLHRCGSLRTNLVAKRFEIPVTTPARTIADLEGVVPSRWVRRAIRQAELAGYQLSPEIEADGDRSDLERDFLRLCRRYGFPAPEVNVKVGRWTVDFLWRAERLVVETDSYDYHRGRIAFQDDRARDLDLRRLGFDVHRFSERQLNEQPTEVAADLREALSPLVIAG
jgi:very-short-patch-repair endonuclease